MSKRKTTEEIIEEIRTIHGDKYDYSKIDYVNNKTKICLICPIHGEFWQTPKHLLRGCGCQKCGGTSKLTTEEFIEKARKIHGGKYDYSKVEYVNNMVKVCIICPIHGEFWQTPHDHLSGKGCKQCGILNTKNDKTKTLEEFIEKAKQVHGNKYDYSKVNYVGSKTKVCIICPIHGEFWQTPNKHLQGNGCQECVGNTKLTIDEFIERAKQIHGDKYDYSKVNYVNSHTKVCIICKKHGEFWQMPYSHLNGIGCKKCLNLVENTEYFIEKARQIHGDKYDYSRVIYKKTNIKVCIVCPKHGEFWQTPNKHLQGNGCPKCNSSHLENEINNVLNENNIDFTMQQTFDWLKDKSLMKLDFYIPSKNIAIECQGVQHFKPVDFGGKGEKWTKEEFLKIQKRDKIKYKLCNENNIKLLYYLGNNLDEIMAVLNETSDKKEDCGKTQY